VSYELLIAENIVLYVRDEGTDEFYVASAMAGVSKNAYHTEHNGIVTVAMGINKKDGTRVAPFTITDTLNMSRYCQEIQFALGRLSLDISYYKVVSDCELKDSNETESASTEESSKQSKPSMVVTSYIIPPSGARDVTEAEIISSIVYKYCQSNELEALEATAFSLTLETDDMNTTSSPSQQALDLVLLQDSTNIMGIGDVDRWDFNSLNLSNTDIYIAVTVMFRVFGFLEKFRITNDKFTTFLTHVASHYRPNPFHNFQHAVQVMHAMYTMIRRECSVYFTPLDIFTMLVAALCHGTLTQSSSSTLTVLTLLDVLLDIDHPGNNNDFEVKLP
jgi:dual 3',5'-cyclic-AMP and -GMP phosphodiesterase 11